eukprot:TRINITY_DN7266_c0_g1_i1.p1 TRINITY_DN7266_c0_g1~~TRINITY_DN7266_c0_g1_i1.p1  ORF type:complete len:324 (-),score=25.68 TRINITY_DN7266_c0_g1_i1:114-1085(-)
MCPCLSRGRWPLYEPKANMPYLFHIVDTKEKDDQDRSIFKFEDPRLFDIKRNRLIEPPQLLGHTDKSFNQMVDLCTAYTARFGYHVGFNNCQNWVKEILKRLNLHKELPHTPLSETCAGCVSLVVLSGTYETSPALIPASSVVVARKPDDPIPMSSTLPDCFRAKTASADDEEPLLQQPPMPAERPTPRVAPLPYDVHDPVAGDPAVDPVDVDSCPARDRVQAVQHSTAPDTKPLSPRAAAPVPQGLDIVTVKYVTKNGTEASKSFRLTPALTADEIIRQVAGEKASLYELHDKHGLVVVGKLSDAFPSEPHATVSLHLKDEL